jgi:hypothetical protein
MKKNDIAKIGTIGRFVLGLSARKKIGLFALLALVNTLCVFAIVWTHNRLADSIKATSEIAKNQKVWLDSAKYIEEDITKFFKSNKFGDIDLPRVKSAIESIAAEAHVEYSIEDLDKRQIGNFAISRLLVNFTDVPLSNLIDFFEKIESLGDNVAIADGKIDATSGNPLNAHCVISILDWIG